MWSESSVTSISQIIKIAPISRVELPVYCYFATPQAQLPQIALARAEIIAIIAKQSASRTCAISSEVGWVITFSLQIPLVVNVIRDKHSKNLVLQRCSCNSQGVSFSLRWPLSASVCYCFQHCDIEETGHPSNRLILENIKNVVVFAPTGSRIEQFPLGNYAAYLVFNLGKHSTDFYATG